MQQWCQLGVAHEVTQGVSLSGPFRDTKRGPVPRRGDPGRPGGPSDAVDKAAPHRQQEVARPGRRHPAHCRRRIGTIEGAEAGMPRESRLFVGALTRSPREQDRRSHVGETPGHVERLPAMWKTLPAMWKRLPAPAGMKGQLAPMPEQPLVRFVLAVMALGAFAYGFLNGVSKDASEVAVAAALAVGLLLLVVVLAGQLPSSLKLSETSTSSWTRRGPRGPSTAPSWPPMPLWGESRGHRGGRSAGAGIHWRDGQSLSRALQAVHSCADVAREVGSAAPNQLDSAAGPLLARACKGLDELPPGRATQGPTIGNAAVVTRVDGGRRCIGRAQRGLTAPGTRSGAGVSEAAFRDMAGARRLPPNGSALPT